MSKRNSPLTIFGEQKGLKIQSNTNQYEIIEIVGYGTFGIVVAAKDSKGEIVALKRVVQDHRYKNRELPMMELLHHENVLELKDSFFSKIPNIKDDYILNIVMDYMPYNLYQVICERKLTEKQINLFSFQLIRSINYIHSLNICHRDIKPQNVMIDLKNNSLKLCDFGSAKQLDPKGTNISYICSRYYRAPELIFDCTQYTNLIDIWAYGCVVAEMIMRKPLFKGDTNTDQLTKIMKVLSTPSVEQIYAMNKSTTMFRMPQITGCGLATVLNIYKPPNGYVQFLEEILKYNPKERLNGLQIIAHPLFVDIRKEFKLTEKEIKDAQQLGLVLK